MSISALDIVSIAQVLTQTALTAKTISEIAEMTPEQVQKLLDKTDATLDQVKADD